MILIADLVDQLAAHDLVVDVDDLFADNMAVFSPCRRYRYLLARTWGGNGKVAIWVMVNPSTADAATDDRTLQRCREFSQREHCGSLIVVNLFALRSADPAALRRHPDPVGGDNDTVLDALARHLADHHDPTLWIGGWGGSVPRTGPHRNRARDVHGMLAGAGLQLHHLGLTETNQPKHPLYLPATTPLAVLPDPDPRRIVVTGSRNHSHPDLVRRHLNARLDRYGRLIVADGDCPTGVDLTTKQWCAEHPDHVTRIPYPADWDHCAPSCPRDSGAHRRRRRPGDIHHPGTLPTYCPLAGPRRNRQMAADGADEGLAFPEPGEANRGTRNCVRECEKRGIHMDIHTPGRGPADQVNLVSSIHRAGDTRADRRPPNPTRPRPHTASTIIKTGGTP